jgi:hypothetical protein
VVLQKGIPAKELESIPTYRLRVLMRWVEKLREGHWVG